MKLLRECKTEEEKQELRDQMLEHMYHQVLATHCLVATIDSVLKENRLWLLKQKLKQLSKS